MCLNKGGTCECLIRNGNSQTYHILTSDFTAGEITDIEAGADTWDAGGSEINRGADWDYVRGSDIGSWGMSNYRFDVATESTTWFFTTMGLPAGTVAVEVMGTSGCTRIQSDILFLDTVAWNTSMPSGTNSTSIGQTAAHEFGHDFGLDHDDNELALMNGQYPNSGDPGDGTFRLHEDDYDALTTFKSDASTGENFLLTRFRSDGTAKSREVWTDDANPSGAAGESGRDWVQAAGTCIPSNPPNDIYVDTNSTTASIASVEIRWTLSSDTICGDGDDIEIDENSYTLVQNTTSATVAPTWCIPGGTLADWYWICAEVDSNHEVSETSSADNFVRSEKLFEVE